MVMLVALSRVKAVLQGQQGMGIIPTRPVMLCSAFRCLQDELWWMCSGDVWECSSLPVQRVGSQWKWRCPYGHGPFSVGRERSSSGQALLGVTVQCPGEGHTLTPVGQEPGGVAMSSFLFPHLSVLWRRFHGSGRARRER